MLWPRVLLLTHQTWLENEHTLIALMKGSWVYVKILCVLKVNISASPTGFPMALIANLLLDVIKQICFEKSRVGGKWLPRELALGKWNFLPSNHRKKSNFVFRNQMILPFLCPPAAYWLLIKLYWSQAFRESIPTDKPSNDIWTLY